MREEGIKRLEEKYGIKVVGDSFYNPLTKNIISCIKCILPMVVGGTMDLHIMNFKQSAKKMQKCY